MTGVEAVIALITILARYGPDAYLKARQILATKEPTEAQWAELDAILMKTGESYFKKGPQP